MDRKSKWGYVDVDGRTVIPFQYEQALGFSCGLAAVSIDGKWGYIDKKGKIVITPQFAGASMFRENRARVNIGGNYYRPYLEWHIWDGDNYWIANGYWQYIDKSGKFISDVKFDDVLDFRDGLAAFRMFKKYGLKDAKGRIVLPAKYDEIDDKFVSGMARVRSKGRWGFIDESGKVTVRPAFDRVRDFGDGPAAVRVGWKWGYVSKDGKIVVKPQFDDARSFSEQRAAVMLSPTYNWKDDRWGYIDTTGKIVLQPVFQDAGSFSESLAAVCVSDKWGYIDKSGKMAIKPQYSSVGKFTRGQAEVLLMPELDGEYEIFRGVIDRQGKYVIPRSLSIGAGWLRCLSNRPRS